MKSFATLAFAGLATAQQLMNITDRCQVVVNQDTSSLTPDVKPIADGLLAINQTTGALYDSIVVFDGSAASVQAVLNNAQATLDTVNTVDTTVKGLTPITDDNALNALNLVQYVSDLACTVNFTVDAFIAQKAGVVAACQGPTALSQLNALSAASTTLINDVTNIINNGDALGLGLKGLAATLSQPILDALAVGIAAYADQTSLPAGCNVASTTTITSGTTTITSGTTTVTSTGTITTTITFGTGYPSKPTQSGIYNNGTVTYGYPAASGPNSYPAGSQPAASSYPAGSQPAASSYPAGSQPAASSYPIGSQPAASYPAASNPAASYAAASQPAASYPAGSQPAASHPAASQPAASYPAGSQPAASYPAASQPAASQPAPSKPAGTVPYTGSATMVASSLSAVIAVFAAAIML